MGAARCLEEKQAADAAVAAAQTTVAAAQTSGDADALAAAQKALGEAEVRALEADVAIANQEEMARVAAEKQGHTSRYAVLNRQGEIERDFSRASRYISGEVYPTPTLPRLQLRL